MPDYPPGVYESFHSLDLSPCLAEAKRTDAQKLDYEEPGQTKNGGSVRKES